MKHSEAAEIIRNALFCVQKVRSISEEQSEGDPVLKRVQRFLEPKIHDDAYMLNPLLKLVARLDDGGQITPMEFYNMMTIMDKWGASVQVSYALAMGDGSTLPEPDVQWIRGWETEEVLP